MNGGALPGGVPLGGALKKRMKKKKNKQKYEIINIKKKIESGYESPVLQP